MRKGAAGSATLAEVNPALTPSVVAELQSLETAFGGRQAIIGLLVCAPLTPDLKVFLGLLGDPMRRSATLAEVCAHCHLLPGDVLKLLADAAIAKGKALASQKVGEGIAAVAEDVMRRAAPYEETCHLCRGTGTYTDEPTKDVPNPEPGPCDTCWGTGKLRHLPELARQELAISMAQLLPKSAGINIAQINAGASGGAGAVGALEKLTLLTDRLLYGDQALDAGSATLDADLIEDSVAQPPAPEADA